MTKDDCPMLPITNNCSTPIESKVGRSLWILNRMLISANKTTINGDNLPVYESCGMKYVTQLTMIRISKAIIVLKDTIFVQFLKK